MVAGIFRVSRTSQAVNDDRNRVREVIVHEDDAQTDAQIIAAVVASLNTAQPVETGSEPVYPAGYFDTVVQVGATPEGELATDGDFYAFAPVVVSATT